MDEINLAGEFGEKVAFFRGRISAADDNQRLVAIARERTVADGAGTDAAIFVSCFRIQAQVVGGVAPVEIISEYASIGVDAPSSRTLKGRVFMSIEATSDVMMRVPYRSA